MSAQLPKNITGVVPVVELAGDDEEDTRLLREALTKATSYLRGFKWCTAIRESYFGTGVGGIVAVFLFRISPVKADEWVWVIVGDIPSAYLDIEEVSTPDEALGIYCHLMDSWSDAVLAGTDLGEEFQSMLLPPR